MNSKQLKITAIGKKNTSGLYIGRPSPLGNPFPVKPSSFSSFTYSIDSSMEKYRKYLLNEFQTNKKIFSFLNFLRDRLINNQPIIINCWCIYETKPLSYYGGNYHPICHGQIIFEILFHHLYGNYFFDILDTDEKYIYCDFHLPFYLLNSENFKIFFVKDKYFINSEDSLKYLNTIPSELKLLKWNI